MTTSYYRHNYTATGGNQAEARNQHHPLETTPLHIDIREN